MPLAGEIYSFPACLDGRSTACRGFSRTRSPTASARRSSTRGSSGKGASRVISTPSNASAILAFAAWARSVRPRHRSAAHVRKRRRGGARRARRRAPHRTRGPWRLPCARSPGARPAGHPASRHLGGRRPRKAVVAWNAETDEVRSGQVHARRRFFPLAHQVRRRSRQQGQGARRSPRLRADRVRVPRHGARRRHRDDQLPDPARERPQPLHDQALRSHGHGPQDPHAIVGRPGALRLQPGGRVLLRAGTARHRQARLGKDAAESSSGAWPSTSSPATRTITSRTSPS